MPSRNFGWGPPAPNPSLCSVSLALFLKLWVSVLLLLVVTGSGGCYKIPTSINATVTRTAPLSPPTIITTSIQSLQAQKYEFINPNGVQANDGHIRKDNGVHEQATKWTSVQNAPPNWAGVRTFETTTNLASSYSDTVSPKHRLHDSNGESSVSSPASVAPNPPTASHAGDLKRSAGIFVLIKAILVSWAILLVGMLSYMIARYAEEILAAEPALEAEPNEDNERTALLGQLDV